MRVNLTHNENIKTFDDVARHAELEEDRLLSEKPANEAFMTESKSRGAKGSRRKHWKGKGFQKGKRENEASSSGQKRKRGKRRGMKSRNKNCLTMANLVTLLMIALSQRYCLHELIPLTYMLVVA